MNLVAYFAQTYLPRLLAKGVTRATIADYETVVKSAPQFPTAESVTQWLADMQSPAATKNRRRRYLLAILRDARKHGLLSEWVEDVPRAYESETLPRAWTVAEFGRLLAVCERLDERYLGIRAELWWRSFLLTAWYTGLRVQTLLDSLCQNLDLGQRTLVVSSTKDRRQIMYVLPEDDCDAIRSIWWHRRHVWPWPFADRKKTLLRRVRQLIEWAELPQLSKPFHAIRRSVASYVTASEGLSCACDYLDHCRPEITRRFYVDPRIAVPTRHAGQAIPSPIA